MTDTVASISQPARAPTVQSDRERWIALVVLCVGFLMIILDQTIVNVALPSIQDDLGFSQSSLAWVVNAYLIAFGGLLLLAGRLGDLIGRRRIFMIGLGVFTAASLLCGLAQSQAVLIGARFLQGAGGAMTAAVILGMIVTMFPEPREQAKAIGVYSFVASAGRLDRVAGRRGYHGGDQLALDLLREPPDRGGDGDRGLRGCSTRDEGIGLARGADVLGAVLVTGSLMLLVYTIVKASDYGWASVHTLGFGSAALGLLGAFILREARTGTPLVPLRIFRSRVVSGANAVQALMVAGLFGMFFLGTLYMQRVLGYGPIEIGLAFLRSRC